MRVLKFGGTSVASAQRIQRVAEIVANAASVERVAVVVSAMAGVTDALAHAADQAPSDARRNDELVADLARRHFDALAALSPNGDRPRVGAELTRWLTRLADSLAAAWQAGSCSPALRDAILATGERLTAPLVAAKLRARGLDAVVVDGADLIATDSMFGEARVDWPRTVRRAARVAGDLSHTAVPVVTGFIAADAAVATTTLGRGGSDYSASLIGAALRASAVEIWTDVDGVLSAPPRLVANAVTIPRLSYAEAATLANLGAKVLHPKTMAPAAEFGIPICVRNSFQPDAPGTRIAADPGDARAEPKAVAALDGEAPLEWEPIPAARRPPDARVATVALVGERIGADPRSIGRLLRALRDGGHRVLALAAEPSGLAVAALVPADEVELATARLHSVFRLADQFPARPGESRASARAGLLPRAVLPGAAS